MKKRVLMVMMALATGFCLDNTLAEEPPEGYWSLQQATEILDKTRRVMLDPDLSALTEAEKAAAEKLMRAGAIINSLYEDSMHSEALFSLSALQALEPGQARSQALLDLYYLFKGPIASTLDNERVPFLPVAGEEPGKNMYPSGMVRELLDPVLEAQPELAKDLLAVRTVVRASTHENLKRDLEMLGQFPLLDDLHPGLKTRLLAIQSGEDDSPWYALPYSVRWAPEIMQIFALINAAAQDVEPEDPDLADYLSLRARDLVSDNYEGGDAAWVRGRFKHLNAQIGSYEVYGDALYGVKSFFSLSLLARDEGKSQELSAALRGLQDIQDSLPLGSGRKIQRDIPVGVYNIIADFGQSRGANTATILPNDPDHTRKYGRTILLRNNIMTHPDLFNDSKELFSAAVVSGQADDLTLEGPFYRTLWHEVGHYLGVDSTEDGRELNEALSPWGSHYEEMKADLVSLFTSTHLNESGLMDDDRYRSVQAAGVLRVLQRNQPRLDQPYQTMQLMQMNYFLEHGLLSFDPSDARLTIHYDRYNTVAGQLLEEVLRIQSAGSSKKAGQFIEKYTSWEIDLHERLAQRLRDSSRYRFRMVQYKALE
ncbi:NUDIX hydrolase [Pseudomonadota bacterium]